MTVKTGQVVAAAFPCQDMTGALVTPSAGPAGVLYVNGVANAATVTITGTNPYKWSVTLPTLAASDRVQVYITATIAGVPTSEVLWEEYADTKLISDLRDAVAAPTATDNADAVWDTETMYHQITGSTGEALTAAGEITDPWESDPENYGTPGSFGFLIKQMDSNLTTILSRLGNWTGTAVNTVLGAFRALLSKTTTAPSDIGGTFDPATDSTEAIRDTAPLGTAMITPQEVRDAGLLAPTGGAPASGSIDKHLDDLGASVGTLTGGVGSSIYTATITDGNLALDNVTVWVSTDLAGTDRVASGLTDAFGIVRLMLDPGNYFMWCERGGTSFPNPTVITVDP